MLPVQLEDIWTILHRRMIKNMNGPTTKTFSIKQYFRGAEWIKHVALFIKK